MGFVELILLFNCGDDKIKSNTMYLSGRFVAVIIAASCFLSHLLFLQEPVDSGKFAEIRAACSKPTCEGSLLEMQTAIGHISHSQDDFRSYYTR